MLSEFRSKWRGISPIISILLLIVIAVSAAVIVYGFLMGFIGVETTSSGGSRATLIVESIGVENGKLIVYVRNTGGSPATVDKVYIESVEGDVIQSLSVAGGGVKVNPKSLAVIEVTLKSDLEAGTYRVKVSGPNALVVASLTLTRTEHSLWLSGWGYRRKISITERSGSTLTDYQVKIVLDSSNFDFTKAKSDGSDIRFTPDDSSTQLSYWIEKWDPVGEEAIVWVKVPSIPASSTTTIYMYYGNPTAASASDPYATFVRVVSGLEACWHLDEGSGAVVHDVGGGGHNGDVIDGTWTTDSKYGYAMQFDGSDDYIIINPFTNFPSDEITAEFWMKSSDTTKAGTPISYAVTTQNNEFLIYNYVRYIYVKGSWRYTGASVNDGSWHHIAVTWKSNGGVVELYVDGSLEYQGTDLSDGLTIISGGSLVLAQEQDSVGDDFDKTQAFLGILDEVRIYNRVLGSSEIADLYSYYGYTTDNSPGFVYLTKWVDPQPQVVVGAEEGLT